MNATLSIGQKVGDFCVEEFVKTSSDNRGESYFVSDKDGRKALMKLYAADYERMRKKFEQQSYSHERHRIGY